MNRRSAGSGPRRVIGHVRDGGGRERLLSLAANLGCTVDIQRRATRYIPYAEIHADVHVQNRASQRLPEWSRSVPACDSGSRSPVEAAGSVEFYDFRSWKDLVRNVRHARSPQGSRDPSIHCLILEARCLAMVSMRQRRAMEAAVEAADVVIACGNLGSIFPPWVVACVDVKCPEIWEADCNPGHKPLRVDGDSCGHENEWNWSRRQFEIAIALAAKMHGLSVGPMQRRVGWLCAKPEHYFVHLLRRLRADSRVSVIVGYQRGGKRWRLVCAVALRRVDVLLVNGWGRLSALLVIALARSVRVPYVIMSDTWIGSPPRAAWYAISSSLARDWVVRGAYRLLPAGQPQAEYVSKSWRQSAATEKVEILHFGVDSERIQKLVDAMPPEIAECRRGKWGVGAADVMVLYVGRLERCKGADRLPAIARGIAGRNDRVKVVVIGDGECKGLMTPGGDGELPMTYLGALFGTDVIEALGCADIVLLPSREEQWGLIVNEALSAGVPVVVTDRVGSGVDLVRPKRAGVVVNDAIPDVIDGVLSLAENGDERVACGARGRKWIDGWNVDVMHEVVCRVCGVGEPSRMVHQSKSDPPEGC